MDLTSLLLRAGAQRPHVLVVPVVGGTAVRLAVEAELARRGWPEAVAPADTDVVVVAGAAGPGLAEVVERIWQQVPAPRARLAITDPDEVASRLDTAAARLADLRSQRGQEPGAVGHGGSAGDSHEGHKSNEQGSEASAEQGDAVDAEDGETASEDGANNGAHGAHGGHGGEMEMPGGLPMADMGEDRDGLMLDRLHVPLGPVLPDWPAGLVVRAVLQGDVIQEAEVEVLDREHGTTFWNGPGGPAARELDALARFLGVAGWPDAAARARRARDQLLAGAGTQDIAPSVIALVTRVRRSRTLRWLVRGIEAGPVDVAARLEQRLDALESAIAGHRPGHPLRCAFSDLPQLLAGAELAAARLVVAVLDPDTEPAELPSGVDNG